MRAPGADPAAAALTGGKSISAGPVPHWSLTDQPGTDRPSAKLSHRYATMVAMVGSKRGRKRDKWYDGCDCGCEICDIFLLSSLLLAFARLGPSRSSIAVTAAIRGYRKISPRLPTRCPYTPTCSAYGLEAVQRYGTRRGLRLTAGRLRRCRPGVAYGTADPVP